MVAERVALSYKEYFEVYVVRPATVCGVSSRMRFDVVVNLFVLQAFKNNEINVLGGDQVRPNIHIDDMVRVYSHLTNQNLASGIYNAGFENLTILQIAHEVQKLTGSNIKQEASNDPRSYRQDSSKLMATGFSPLFGVKNAIEDIYSALQNAKLTDRPEWHTVNWMKNLGLSFGH
jgi:nucleoside-diphosphate-sugar epimerase